MEYEAFGWGAATGMMDMPEEVAVRRRVTAGDAEPMYPTPVESVQV